MSVASCLSVKSQVGSSESKHSIKQAIQLINQNDMRIRKKYLVKNTMNKCRPLPMVQKSIQSGLLREKTLMKKGYICNAASDLPIQVAFIEDKCYYYKLPENKRLSENIKLKLQEEVNKRSKSRLPYGGKNKIENDHFKKIRNRGDKHSGNTDSTRHLILSPTINKETKSEYKRPRNLSIITTEAELTPERFFKHSSNASFQCYPAFQSFVFKDAKQNNIVFDTRTAISPDNAKPRLSRTRIKITNLPEKYTDIKDSVAIPKRKCLIPYPVIPSFVNMTNMPTGGNIMEGEDVSFVLSVLYTEKQLDSSLRQLRRTFSGNVQFYYRSHQKWHQLYSGNFGHVDGIIIHYDRTSLTMTGTSESIFNTRAISRESFQALSHMFNLHKLIGKPTSPLASDINFHRLLTDNSITCSVFEKVMKSENVDTGSLTSVDFELINKFTEKLNSPHDRKVHSYNTEPDTYLNIQDLMSTFMTFRSTSTNGMDEIDSKPLLSVDSSSQLSNEN